MKSLNVLANPVTLVTDEQLRIIRSDHEKEKRRTDMDRRRIRRTQDEQRDKEQDEERRQAEEVLRRQAEEVLRRQAEEEDMKRRKKEEEEEEETRKQERIRFERDIRQDERSRLEKEQLCKEPNEFNELLATEIQSRLATHQRTRVVDETKTKELAYWREKANRDEEAAIRRSGVILILLANGIESINSALNCKAIKTKGLSDDIEAAVDSGEFDTCIKSLAITPTAMKIINNPIASFSTTFGSILLSTHMRNMKEEAAGGIKALQANIRTRDVPSVPPVVKPNRRTARKLSPSLHIPRKSMIDAVEPSSQPLDGMRTQMENFSPLVNGISKLMTLEENK